MTVVPTMRWTFIYILIHVDFHYNGVSSHGMVLNPVARGSRWRYNSSAPHNYNDAELNCGGMSVQWNQNKGKCGICGDNYADTRPRRHEIGGEFGEPIIVGSYTKSSKLHTEVDVTANHKGKFWFELCKMDRFWENGAKNEEEDCFDTKLLTTDGKEYWWLSSNANQIFEIDLQLPNITCKHCIFRWTWSTGENSIWENKLENLLQTNLQPTLGVSVTMVQEQLVVGIKNTFAPVQTSL